LLGVLLAVEINNERSYGWLIHGSSFVAYEESELCRVVTIMQVMLLVFSTNQCSVPLTTLS
jgi:hypothetical protein